MSEFKEPRPNSKPKKRVSAAKGEILEMDAFFSHFDDQAHAMVRSEARACGEFRNELSKHGFSDEECYNLTMERFFPGCTNEDD